MIDINFIDKNSLVRANIGDATGEFVSEETITTALLSVDNNVNKASVLVMEAMLTWFSTLAEKEIVDEVEVTYGNLYNKYKVVLDNFKSKVYAKNRIPILIGGVSLEEKNRINEDLDTVSPFDYSDWDRLVNRTKLFSEDENPNYGQY